ncbi:MAG: FAD-dependent oxidoreductase [Candidatus Velthaea sp.]
MMLGLLLARAGIDVVVLEKHGDFLRDFRGDTIHPSTLEIMHELGLLEAFLQRPHQEVRALAGQIGDDAVTLGDFSHVPTHCKFLLLMPQWEFLDFLAESAQRYPTFRLMLNCAATDLVYDGDAVAGLRANAPDGPLEIRATLVVGADGRHSVIRERAALTPIEIGAPIDVLWMRISRRNTDPASVFARIDYGQIMVLLDRGEYWQCAYIINKGAFEAVRARGIEAFRANIGALVPFVRDRLGELRDWDDIRLLTVAVDRLQQWYRPGLLCIGDAAHAMSPIGGVGINLAVQDAVATANLLYPALRDGTVSTAHLAAVQRRRTFPTRVIQGAQVAIQNRLMRRILGGGAKMRAPFVVKLLDRWPVLRRIPAYVVGIGPRPEHVRTPQR